MVPSPIPLKDLKLGGNAITMIDRNQTKASARSRRTLANKNVGRVAVAIEKSDVKEGNLLDFEIADMSEKERRERQFHLSRLGPMSSKGSAFETYSCMLPNFGKIFGLSSPSEG